MVEPNKPKDLKFLAFTPMIDMGFWSTLAKKKLEEYKLDDSARTIVGKYKINNFKDKVSHLCFDLFSLNAESVLNDQGKSGPVEVKFQCKLKNTNTIEEFQAIDYKSLQESLAEEILKNIDISLSNSEAEEDEFALNPQSMSLCTFADLKNHLYHYKLVAPALKIDNIITEKPIEPLKGSLDEKVLVGLEEFLRAFVWKQKSARVPPFIFVEQTENSFRKLSFSQYLNLSIEKPSGTRLFILYVDSHNQPESTNSQILNIIAKLLRKCESDQALTSVLTNVNFILLKDFFSYNENKCITFKTSLIWSVNLKDARISYQDSSRKIPNTIGNDFSLEPKVVDLKSHMDEKTLAANAVDLNLKLMKWRLLPELDLELIHATKVLIIGAGTLGCQLARNLIAWGVREITFIDYGKVAYSNPVRQSLYTFEDSKLGKHKAECAAESLKKIFPDIKSIGYNMKIPMPGHFVTTSEQAKGALEDVQFLDDLVKNHDGVFLLTDTRESRWLPTLLANKHNKICMSVALGFDSFLVIRHGLSPKVHNDELHGERHGCYFCNDIIAPTNTLADRTLDQQCTVTRPGLSYISTGFASELFISILHHPLRQGAPASDEENATESCLGILPQHIRGTLSDFEIRNLTGKSFSNCIACSVYVLDEYLNNRDDFILKVINSPNYLQDVSKITENLQDVGDNEFIEFD